MSAGITVREARPDQYTDIGELTARTYAAMERMPPEDAMPEYYADLRDVESRAAAPGNHILAAYGADGALLGSVGFVYDMAYYGAPVRELPDNASGFRVLVVDPVAQGRGIGRALALDCIGRAQRAGRQHLVLHTTPIMEIAQELYRKLGFRRTPELDFQPDGIPIVIMGYVLDL